MSPAKKATKKTPKRPSPKKTAKKTAKKSPKKTAKKTAKKSSPKKTAKKTPKKPAPKKTAKKPRLVPPALEQVALDGSQLDHLLDLIGAPPAREDPPALRTLEELLGAPVPGELRRYLAREASFDHGDAEHPKIRDGSFAGALPDVPAWLAQLAQPHEGLLQAVHQMCGLYPLGAKLDCGDFMYALAGLERWGPLDSGGVFYYDEREVGGWGEGTLSGFFRRELEKLYKEVDGARDEPDEDVEIHDLRDIFFFDAPAPGRPPPPAIELSPELQAAWDEHSSAMTERFTRAAALVAALRGRVRDVRALPTEARWLAERERVATSHAAAMYWLLAHWLFDNGPELADAVERAAANPSRLVAALRAHVTKQPAANRYRAQQRAVFEAVERAAAE